MTAMQALEHAFATARTAAEFNRLLDAAGPLAEAAAKRLGLVSRGGVYVPAEQPKPAPQAKPSTPTPKAKPAAAAQTKPAPAPAPMAEQAAQKPAAPKAKPNANKPAPADDKAPLVAAYKAARLPGFGLCHRWGTETLRRKLAEQAKGTKQAAKSTPAPKAAPRKVTIAAGDPALTPDDKVELGIPTLASATVDQLKAELARRLAVPLADLDAALSLLAK
jgi:hypothetical protein